jgi:endonuclease/exonuclease/phosphatase family metal-dependent hydrolase
MKLIKRVVAALFVLLLAFFAFYLWSSGSSSSQKLQLIHRPLETTASNDSTIKIMTYNVGYLSGMTNNSANWKDEAISANNYKKLINLLDSINPDLISFQEIDYHSKRSDWIDLHDSLESSYYPWSVKAINWDNNYVPFPYWPPRVHFGRILSGQSIMSKWKLADPTREVLQKVESNPFYYNAYYLDRLLVSAKVEHPVRPFLLMNIHAEAFDTLTRNEQLASIYKTFKTKSVENPIIIAGDFNASPESEEPGLQLFLRDSTIGCVALHPDQPNYYTFSSGNPAERIDYIFYTKKDFVEWDGHVATEFGEISDHLPVIARLKFKN